MIAMTFDLSSKCIGITFAQLDGTDISYGETLAVIPKKPDPRDLGYTTKTPKKIGNEGSTYAAFLKPHEKFISKSEADRRKRDMKNLEHNYLLRNIGEQCGRYLDKVKPDIVAIEKNKSFNGILTTKLLAEIAGGIYFYCGAKGIPLYDWDESVIRAQIRRDIPNVSLAKVKGESGVTLDTKWEIYCRLREYFESEHPGIFSFDDMVFDESDSLAVFYYLLKNVIAKG